MTADAFFASMDDARDAARAAGRFAVAEALDDALFMAVSAWHDSREDDAPPRPAGRALGA